VKIIAYTIGSFWVCPECFTKSDERGEPTTTDQLMDCYSYRCDDCGKNLMETEES
jgi:hypothetical protein